MKTIAFLMVCFCLCQAMYDGLRILHQVNKSEIRVTSDAPFVADYTQSEAFVYDDYRQVTGLLQQVINEKEVNDDHRSGLNHRVAYYVNDGKGFEYYNTSYRLPEQFTAYTPVSYIFDRGRYTSFYNHSGSSLWSYTTNQEGETSDLSQYQIYFAFLPQYLSTRQAAWDEVRHSLNPGIYIVVGCLLLAVLLTVYLTFVTGRRSDSDELYLSTFDRMYSDLILFLQMCFGAAWLGLIAVYNEQYLYSYQSSLPAIWFAVIVTAIISPCILALYLSLIRKIKAGRLLRHSLAGAIIFGVCRLVKGFFMGIARFIDLLFVGRRFQHFPFARALFRRQSNYLMGSATVVFFFSMFTIFQSVPGMMVMVVVEVALTARFVRANNNTFEDMEQICSQVYEVYQGNMDFNPQLRGGTQLYATSRQLLDIGEGMNRSVTRQLASERTKIALVTNVSHDLKTPLTSIIGYIDLLSKDETLSAEARDYVTVLTNKSQRLKTIIEDLFDLAKTTSGDDNLHLEVLDLRRLMEQSIVEMEDKINQSKQVLKLTLPDQAIYTRADGRKLYRVVQNVLDNALKYSMPGTRIFITLSHDQTQGRIDFKNTASYEMNFTAQEILERFARGDEARTSEGSGLGLSIAEGFTRACGGDMQVKIDGDQFKLSLTFPLVSAPGEQAEAALDQGALEEPTLAMEDERGKVYRPREDVPPRPITTVSEDHFEPEKPVEIAELESVLEAFDKERYTHEQTAGNPAADVREQIKGVGQAAMKKLGALGAETGEALEYLKGFFNSASGQSQTAKEEKWRQPKAFSSKSPRREEEAQEPQNLRKGGGENALADTQAAQEEVPEFIRHFHELKAQERSAKPATSDQNQSDQE